VRQSEDARGRPWTEQAAPMRTGSHRSLAAGGWICGRDEPARVSSRRHQVGPAL